MDEGEPKLSLADLEYKKVYVRRRRALFAAAGLCCDCGKEPRHELMYRGPKCLAKQRRWSRHRKKAELRMEERMKTGDYQRKLATGLCTENSCKQPPEEGRKRCRKHLDRANQYQQRKYREKMAARGRTGNTAPTPLTNSESSPAGRDKGIFVSGGGTPSGYVLQYQQRQLEAAVKILADATKASIAAAKPTGFFSRLMAFFS